MEELLFKELYSLMFNAATDAIAALNQGEAEAAALILIRAQQSAEERYLCQPEHENYATYPAVRIL